MALACSILLMFWEASFSFCFEILLNGILLVIGYYSFIDSTNISILLGTVILGSGDMIMVKISDRVVLEFMF